MLKIGSLKRLIEINKTQNNKLTEKVKKKKDKPILEMKNGA